MKRNAVALTLAVLMAAGPALGQAKDKDPGPLIQIAILLDTSNSMDGLIDQAKSQLWRIVNELSLARKGGRPPRLEVALYEYGNSGLERDHGYLRRVSPLTRDLDLISEQLFGLRTNGGLEYCGWAILAAADELEWSRSDGDLKLVFIAGNEEYTQGKVDYKQACAKAKGRGIVVNTIFCGSLQEGERTGWRDGAELTGGRYSNIDQEQRPAAVDAPQDPEIAELNLELNRTFLAWGGSDRKGKERQMEQDRNASAYSSQMMTERTMAKATAQYTADWDLVDAVRSGAVDLAKVEDAKLPQVLRGKTPKAKREYVDQLHKKRTDTGEKIRKLYLERQQYVAAKLGVQQSDKTLDYAVIQAVRSQAKARGFSFE
jgi:hypothetical protein